MTTTHNNNFCSKRIINEQMRAYENGENWIIPNIRHDISTMYVPITLYKSLQTLARNKQPVLHFVFPTSYPMKPPTVTYHGTNVQEIFRTNSIFSEDMMKISNMKCLCCESILCRNKWTVAHGIQAIIDEFIKITTLKSRVIERLYCKTIQKQLVKSQNSFLLVEDYPIFEYL
jgi:ubiquitin-protein ligase|tara:strand:+ start:14362 stop:14880 length:519 start_codon:yes stop_codon:yes gene_type:complete